MPPVNSYIWDGDQDLETVRLDLLETVYDLATHDYLRAVGVPRGGRCLEVGAGRGSIVLYLLSVCGLGGEVVATDIDMHWLNQISHPNLRAVEHNIVTDDVAALGTFDLIHVRFVLHHLGNTEGIGALRRLIGLLRPGGRILVEDVLHFGLGDEGSARGHDYSEEGDRAVSETRTWGIDILMGLYPRRVMLEAGLVDVGNELRGSVTRGGDPYREWLAVSISRGRDLIDQTRGSPGAGDDLVNLNRDPDTFGTSRLMSATWGTRAADGD